MLRCSRVVTSRALLYIPERRSEPNEDISVTRQKEERPPRSIPRFQITRTMADFASIVAGRAATGRLFGLEWQRASVLVLCRFLKRRQRVPAVIYGPKSPAIERTPQSPMRQRERERDSAVTFRTLVETIRPASMPIVRGTNRVKRISQKIRIRRTLSVYGYSDHLTMVVPS